MTSSGLISALLVDLTDTEDPDPNDAVDTPLPDTRDPSAPETEAELETDLMDTDAQDQTPQPVRWM
jgi:hypothetical protein